jgi:hypothetical protein
MGSFDAAEIGAGHPQKLTFEACNSDIMAVMFAVGGPNYVVTT